MPVIENFDLSHDIHTTQFPLPDIPRFPPQLASKSETTLSKIGYGVAVT